MRDKKFLMAVILNIATFWQIGTNILLAPTFSVCRGEALLTEERGSIFL
jgi:hypothetical protein